MRPVALAFALLGLAGCLPTTSEASFISGRDELLCDGVYPVCKGKYAGCVLREEQYLRGNFPGSRKFLVETTPGDWVIRVLVFLEERLSPGTETTVSWFEPGCADQYRYQSSKDKLTGDIFEKAGRDQVLEIEHAVTEPGDHLMEIYSDATCRYDLRVEVVKKQ
ncbi:MAG: hypothetical protein IT371_01200 [Deltaproteobacteria bacterium]|nr:hypothetical protein [Deltaproteobacteria bacterium]